jgi:caa(3)-type oxidase subunit IV
MKTYLVGYFFMHLKFENRMFRIFVGIMAFVFISFMAILFFDYSYR